MRAGRPKKSQPAKKAVQERAKKNVQKGTNKAVQEEVKSADPTQKITAKVVKDAHQLRLRKKALMSELTHMKRRLARLRATQKDKEFQALANGLQEADLNKEFKSNVEAWSKYTSFHFDSVLFKGSNQEDKTRKWTLTGSVGGIDFVCEVHVAVNETTNKGRVERILLETPNTNSIELQPWIEKVEGNVELLLKTLRAYAEMSAIRDRSLRDCKEEYEDTLSVIDDEKEGGKIIEITVNRVYYFKIKWKLIPSTKMLSVVKNVCKIACTNEGNEYVQSNMDLQTLKKRLNDDPKGIILELANGVANGGSAKNT